MILVLENSSMKKMTIIILALFCFTSCSKDIDYSPKLEGRWKLTKKEKNGVNIYSGSIYNEKYIFDAHGANEGSLTVEIYDISSSSIDRFIDQYEIIDDEKTLIRRYNSISVYHNIITLSNDELILSYSLTSGDYIEYFKG